jgi:hypothetical protein
VVHKAKGYLKAKTGKNDNEVNELIEATEAALI